MKNITFKDIVRVFIISVILVILVIGFCLYIVDRQKENTVKEMANKVLVAADYYIAAQFMENKSSVITVNFPNNDALGIRGNLPKNGYLKINIKDKIETKFHYNGYCVTKLFDENDVKIEKMKEKECLGN